MLYIAIALYTVYFIYAGINCGDVIRKLKEK